MNLRRPPRPGTPPTALQRPVMLDRGATQAAPSLVASAAADLKAGMDDFLRQLDTALREDPSLDRDARDALMQQFEDAMGGAGGDAGASIAALADRSLWADAVQSLRASGAMGESEANDLIRQINQALQPLQRRESQLAIEFSRRLQSEGEEKALAWFRKEAAALNNAPDAERAPAARPSADVSPLRSDTIHSRSRRLRGPPIAG